MINLTERERIRQYTGGLDWRFPNGVPAVAAKKHDIDLDAQKRLALRFRSAEAILDICLVAAICLALVLVTWVVTQGS